MVKKLNPPFKADKIKHTDKTMELLFPTKDILLQGLSMSSVSPKGGTDEGDEYRITDEDCIEQYGMYKNRSCLAHPKLPNADEHYISAKETISFQESKIDINLREIVEKYIEKYNGQADPVELAKVIWDQAIDVAKIALEDYFKRAGGKSVMVTKYVNNRLDKYYMNKT